MYINKSLSFLEQVIVALADKNRDHIPYRQSKLTHVLKDSLGAHSVLGLVGWAKLLSPSHLTPLLSHSMSHSTCTCTSSPHSIPHSPHAHLTLSPRTSTTYLHLMSPHTSTSCHHIPPPHVTTYLHLMSTYLHLMSTYLHLMSPHTSTSCHHIPSPHVTTYLHLMSPHTSTSCHHIPPPHATPTWAQVATALH